VNLRSGRTGLLTVYADQTTTAGAMSKNNVARRQSDPVQKLAPLLVNRRYKVNKTRTCTNKTLHDDPDQPGKGEAG